jgi:hypothetical protein
MRGVSVADNSMEDTGRDGVAVAARCGARDEIAGHRRLRCPRRRCAQHRPCSTGTPPSAADRVASYGASDCLHRCRAGRPRRVPDRVPRPDPGGLCLGSAPVRQLVPGPLRYLVVPSAAPTSTASPGLGSHGTGPCRRHPGGCPPSLASISTPSRRGSWAALRRRMSGGRRWTTSPTRLPWTATSPARCSWPPGSAPPPGHALISLPALNGLRVSEATGADIEHVGLDRGNQTLTITRKPVSIQRRTEHSVLRFHRPRRLACVLLIN